MQKPLWHDHSVNILFIYLFLRRLVMFSQAWKNKVCVNSIPRDLILVGYLQLFFFAQFNFKILYSGRPYELLPIVWVFMLRISLLSFVVLSNSGTIT